MIDIHTHILPGIDDGADSLEHSILLAEQAVNNGIHTVIATPHHHARGYYSEFKQISELTAQLNEALVSRKIPLTVLVGQEIRLYDQLLEDLEKGSLATLASNDYMLIEFSSSSIPDHAAEVFHELRLLQITPIIAHPERNRVLANNHNMLQELIEEGALAQLTSSSISGTMGKKLQHISIDMCKKGLVHFIASDAHHVQKRPFDLAQGYEAIRKHLGEQFVNYYQLNAEQLVLGNSISRDIPVAKRRFIFW